MNIKGEKGPKGGFLKELIEKYIRLKSLRPNEVCIFNVITEFGSYQLMIGPEYKSTEIKKLKVEPHSRPVEINGSIHHLFIDRTQISPTPKQEEIRRNLKGSVIMKDVVIHIYDNDGHGTNVKIEQSPNKGIEAKQKINLAGESGEKMLLHYRTSGKLVIETYKIVQEDILKTLKKFG